MLKIVLVTVLLAAVAQAAVLDSARVKRSPYGPGSLSGSGSGSTDSEAPLTASEMTKPFMAWAAKDSAQVNAQVKENWNNKAEQGREIQRAGERTEKEGKANAKQVETLNRKAVVKALGDVDKATDDAGTMQGLGQGHNNNNNYNPIPANNYNPNNNNNNNNNNGQSYNGLGNPTNGQGHGGYNSAPAPQSTYNGK